MSRNWKELSRYLIQYKNNSYLSRFNRYFLRNLRLYIVSILIILFFSVSLNAQDRIFKENDSIQILDAFLTFEDSLTMDSVVLPEELIETGIKKKFSPNPNKAIVYAAIFPGLGQIYNRKYWKLPLVYGSALGCVYAISWNGTQYSGYKHAYSDFVYTVNNMGNAGFDTNRNSWEDYIRIMGKTTTDLNEWQANERTRFSQILKSQRDRFRRYRDLSYIVSVGVYALWIIDAYVDAQLFNFDISEDLSMNMQPVMFERTTVNKNTFGLQCSFTF